MIRRTDRVRLCLSRSAVAVALGVFTASTAVAQQGALAWAGDTVAVIGTLDGPPHETFGRLWRAQIRRPDHLYLFDFQGGYTFWYGLNGRFRGSIAARGAGPGELGQPIDVHVDEHGAIWVLDPGNARISRFATAGDAIRFEEAIRHPLGLGTICTLGDRMFHATSYRGNVLHQISRNGVERSVGEIPEMSDLADLPEGYRHRAEVEVFEGAAHCSESQNLIVVAFAAHPRVQAFDRDGRLLWTTELPNLEPLRFGVTDAGRFRAAIPQAGVHFLKSLVPWTDSALLMQYEWRVEGEPPAGREFHGIDSRLVDLRTGRVLARRTDMPLIGARGSGHIVLIENVPFPKALVVRLR